MTLVEEGYLRLERDPVDAQDAATKGYVDNMLLSFGISLGSTGIQGLLNAGYCPLDILNAGAEKDSLYGKIYQRGLIIYLDDLDTISGIKGFVCAPADQSTGIEWGCFQTDLPSVPNVQDPLSGLGAEIGDGITNTAAILSDCPMAPAALACTGYMGGSFMDWFFAIGEGIKFNVGEFS
jgi:hypothetical protein